ncbi:hypothetical protein IKG50_03255 [Candidatus Saccharibacteria bacterium]|nr:hypothetical protein [Candidatus Saccharibacteria bacterium]
MLADVVYEARKRRNFPISEQIFTSDEGEHYDSVAFLPPKKYGNDKPILKISKFEKARWIIPQSFHSFLGSHRDEFFSFLFEHLDPISSSHWRTSVSLIICANKNIDIFLDNGEYSISRYSDNNRYAKVDFNLHRFHGIDGYTVSDIKHKSIKVLAADNPASFRAAFKVKQASIFDDDIDWSHSEAVGFELLELSLWRFLDKKDK